MEKLFKKVVSIVCAIALAVTGIVFTPSSVDAAINDVPNSIETKVGAWGLYAANEGWAGYSEMQYDYTSGTAVGDTKIILKNSPYGNYNQVSWGTYARLANYLPTLDLKADETYRLQIKVDISGNNTETNEQNGKGYMLANIQGKVYKFNINKTGNDQTFATTTTFDYDALAGETSTPSEDPNDIYFYLAGLNSGTEITFKEIKAVVDNDGWAPVTNWNPDDAQPGEVAPYQTAGKLKVLAMYGPKSGMWAKLKTKKRPDSASEATVYDTMVKVTNAGWVDNGTGERSWAGSIRLEDYCDKTAGLVSGEEYKGTIKIHSSKATINDTHGRENKLMVVVDGKSFYTSLEANKTATIDLGQFEYTGDSNIDINLDGLDKDTEIYIEEIKFEDQTGSGWTAVPNEGTTTSDQTGAWELFARTCTGIGDDNSQWGALSYKNAPGVTTPEDMEDTLIKVRSSSGWHGAWATLGTLHGYLNTHKLTVGKKYLTKVRYYSNKKTGKDKFGKDKTLLLSVDTAQVTMPLEACNDDGTYSDVKEYTTPSKDGFIYEKEQTENDPTSVVLNMDQLDKGTELRIFSIEFIEDPSYEWTPVPNNEYTQAGNTWMNCYARTEEEVSAGSWGKMSYKIEGDDTDYRNVTVLNRSVSGWFVTNNPANVVEFQNITDKDHLNLKKGYTYSGKIVVSSTLTDPEAIARGDHNVIKLVKDADEMEKVEKITLNDNGDTVIDIPEFVFTEKTKDIKFILDMMTKNSEFKVKSIEFTHKSDEPDYEPVPNDTAVQTGAWWLYALSGQDGAWGEMMYSTAGSAMGDTTIYCFNTSGWFPGNAGMLATLSDYLTNEELKLQVNKKYSVAITLDTDKDIAGVDDDGVQHNVRVTINDQNYDFEAYKGEHTYVIPCTSAPYSLTASQDVVFNLDTAPAQTKVKIKDVKFGNPIDDPKPITTLNGTVNTDKTVKVDWEQDANTYYGTLATPCGFNVYVDGNKVNTELVKNYERTFTTAALSTGKHKIKVVPTLGAVVSAGSEIEVTVGDTPTETQTQAPTETATQAPTAKPTAAPATTKAPTVVKPGKATVKKAVKKKKSAKKIKVTLKKVAGATKYQVAVYKTKKNAKKNKKALVKKTVTKLTVTIKSKKLKGKKTVYVRARAWNTAGYGAWGGIKKSKKK